MSYHTMALVLLIEAQAIGILTFLADRGRTGLVRTGDAGAGTP